MTPRLPPLDREEIDPDLLELPAFRRSGRPQPYNIYRTMAHHPELLRQWLVFADGIRFTGVLAARATELLILRTGWNCRSEYEWGQHVRWAHEAGITEVELRALCRDVESHEWNSEDAALLGAADELHRDSTISDDTWQALSRFFDAAQLIEIVLLVGQYHGVSYLLNAARVERDPELSSFPSDSDSDD
jgi:4-carboxymuconolactone decarboxylase